MRLQALWSIHSATLLLGATGLFARSIELGADQIIAWRALFAAALLFLFIRSTTHLQCPSKFQITWLLLCGVATGLHWITFFHAMQIAGVAVGMLALFTFPVFIVLLEPWVNHTRFDKRDLVACLLVFVGIFIMVDKVSLHSQTTLGIAWGVFSAIIWALRNIYFKKHLASLPSAQSMMWQLWVIALCLLPISLPSFAQVKAYDWLLLFMLALICTALGHTLVLRAMRTLSAKTTGLIACLQPVYGALLAWWVLNESLTYQVAIGGAFIMAAAVWETLKARRAKR